MHLACLGLITGLFEAGCSKRQCLCMIDSHNLWNTIPECNDYRRYRNEYNALRGNRIRHVKKRHGPNKLVALCLYRSWAYR